jgi:hypothetical protein
LAPQLAIHANQDKEIPMSQEIGAPSEPPPVVSLPWSEVWIKAITQPSVGTYEELVRDPKATAGRAYAWVFVAALIGYAGFFLVQRLVCLVLYGAPNLGSLGASGTTNLFGTSTLALICGAPLTGILEMVVLTIIAGISQLIARALGGTGTYSKLAYAFSAYIAPLTLINSVLGSNPFVNCLSIPIAIYAVVLNVTAVKAVQQFNWGRAIASSVLIIVVVLIIVAWVMVIILALLGPAVGSVFSSNIIVGI